MTPDLSAALDDVMATGATRILTSGGAPSVQQGMAEIARMVKAARGRIAIMPGGGITAENIASIAQAPAPRVPFERADRISQPGPLPQAGMAMGDLRDREYRRFSVRAESVRALLQGLDQALQPQSSVPLRPPV
jgi:copper homeostasis protein